MKDPVVGMILVVGLLAFLFAGDPDLHDALIKALMGDCK